MKYVEKCYGKIYISNMAIKKNLSIETLRGIAILLVVIGHVIGSAPTGGMKIDFPHPLRYLYLWIDFIQMPLFTAIAGWAYALKPYSKSAQFGIFCKNKALRLLVPMATVSTLYFLIQYIIPGTNQKGDLSQLWRIYIFPYTIYWYLPSLFIIFLIQWWIDKWEWMNSWKQWWICLFVSVFLSLIIDRGVMHLLPNIFSFKGAFNQLPYFFVGVAVQRLANASSFFMKQRYLGIILLLCCVCLMYFVWIGSPEDIVLLRLCYPILIIPVLFQLFSIKWHSSFFIWIGGYAYSIYLFHGFGTSGGRILLKVLGMKMIYLIFTLTTIISTMCPILLDRVVCFSKLGRRYLLGKW